MAFGYVRFIPEVVRIANYSAINTYQYMECAGMRPFLPVNTYSVPVNTTKPVCLALICIGFYSFRACLGVKVMEWIGGHIILHYSILDSKGL
jgi:hypothetical protein